jgi:hypothetical protein
MVLTDNLKILIKMSNHKWAMNWWEKNSPEKNRFNAGCMSSKNSFGFAIEVIER